MKALLAPVALLLLLAACKTPAAQPLTPYTPSGNIQSVRVFIGDSDKGVTPTTVQVRRGFGEREITLYNGKELVRRFFLERVPTSNASELEYSYKGDSDASGMTSYDVEHLNVTRDGSFIIPYMPGQIAIEDRQFGLTLIVGN